MSISIADFLLAFTSIAPPANAMREPSARISVSAGANGADERWRVQQEAIRNSDTGIIRGHAGEDFRPCDENGSTCIASKVGEQCANAALNIAAATRTQKRRSRMPAGVESLAASSLRNAKSSASLTCAAKIGLNDLLALSVTQ